MNSVMDRYRELGSNLEASIQVQTESQEKGQQHWHRLYERCWCGYLTVPAKYYEYKDGRQTNTQAQAEKAYLESVEPVTQHGVTPMENIKVCNGCGKQFSNRGATCNACRQAAYRERSK